MWRGLELIGLAALLAGGAGACGKSEPAKVIDPTLACPTPIDQACAADGCPLTWDVAQTANATCAGGEIPPRLADCGSYHVALFFFGDGSSTFYYDLASGALVAEVTFSANDGSTNCTSGPSSGFLPPDCPAETSWTQVTCPDADAGAGTDDGSVQ
jgi:hypothetical protein